ncbi:hypothetical protein ES288_D11G391300v1 [Gossypium darwinii]|uniref:Uncharacterized protein n=1 Tax=Gossypium darwinii TaxID=34276 RepID=A0A5D2AU79_GOSDA|nr:hypothetical protein ES288_D11G391300v1 [Gossypium darwinii]
MYFKINSYQNGLNLNVYFILCRIFRFLSYLHTHTEKTKKVMLSFLGLFCVHLSLSSSSRFMGRNAFNCLE